MDLIERCFCAAVFLEYGFGLSRPREAYWFVVVFVDVVVDGVLEFVDTLEYAPANTLVGDLGEPAFDEVEPGSLPPRRDSQKQVSDTPLFAELKSFSPNKDDYAALRS